MVFGEISSKAKVDYPKVVRKVIEKIGYDHTDKCFDFNTCAVLVAIEDQSDNIAESVHEGKQLEDVGAGDQVSTVTKIGGDQVTHSHYRV